MKKGMLWYVYHVPVLSPILLVFRSKLFSQTMGYIFRSPFWRFLIRPLCRLYSISLDSYIMPEWSFQTLNDFFIRHKKSSFLSFPIETSLGSPADACVEIFRDISVTDQYCIKGYKAKLVDIFWPDIADFEGGDVCFCRLRFSDYHRFHFIDSGEIISSIDRDGPLYSVDQSVLDTGLWVHNKSHLMRLRTNNFGEILWLEVGATNVGSITNHKKIGDDFSRGEEKWYFELGWSAILLVFQKKRIQWSSHLLEKTLQKEELEVTVGTILGQRN